MTFRVELCPYGDPALIKLRALIEEAKGDDPFQPVTVIVERGTVGLDVRRALASTVAANGRRGVANVAFTTVASLADSLVGAQLAERGLAPLTDAVLRAAVQVVLQEWAGSLLGPARHHPSTIDALVLTYRELRMVDDEAIDRLAKSSARAAEVVAVIRAARERTAAWFDEADLLDSASRAIGIDTPSGLGSVVVYLPSSLTPPAARLVRGLASRIPCTAVVGITGDEDADGLSHQLVAALRPAQVPEWPEPTPVSRGDRVLSAPTADAELLAVLRDLMTQCEGGTRPERIALVHSGSPQYVTLLHNMLESAGIPFNGSGVRPLSATVPGRMLLGALRLPENDWRREDVAAWLATGPLMYEGRPIPAARWDVLSAEAGVVGGLHDWHRQLESRARALRAEAAQGDDDDAPWRRAREVEADRCESLIEFLDDIVAQVTRSPGTWDTWAEWAKRLLRSLAGGSHAIDTWPAAERAAAEAVEEAIGRLGVLGELHSPLTPSLAQAALVAELEVPAPQTSRFGTGVWVGSIGAVVGLSLDVLYVVGMNDGVFPGRPSDDVLIPDHEREAARSDGSIPLRGRGALIMRRDYLAALAGAQRRVLSFPRGNQRDGRDLRPSRWLLDTLGLLSHRESRLYSSELETVPASEDYRVAASYIGTVGAPGVALSLDDRDLRSLLHWTESRRPLGRHWLVHALPRLARGVEFSEGSQKGFTRFAGNLGAAGSVEQLRPALLSATRLETFARCPRSYLFEYVLDVQPRPVSQLLLSADPAERGSLMHRILERFVARQIGQSPGAGPADPFATTSLLQIADEEMAVFEADGLAGPRSQWRCEQVRIRRELRRFASEDRQWRIAHGATTLGVEVAFGHRGTRALTVGGAVWEPVQFRGTLDRLDVLADGARVVTDYKTGKPDRFTGIEGDHFLEGRSVQLAIYGLMAAEGSDPVTTEYWFVSEGGGFKRLGFRFSSEDAGQLEAIVGTYAESMGQGHFPANPGGEHQCERCSYNDVCPSTRRAEWDRVKHAPELRPYVDLVGDG